MYEDSGCLAPNIAAVHIYVDRNFPGRKGWILRVILRAQQTLLFRADKGEQNRPPWPFRQCRHGLADLEQLCHAGTVISSTVVNDVTLRIRFADAEMIVMSRIDHRLVSQQRIAARQ